MFEIIKTCFEKKKIVSVYTRSDRPEMHYVGYISKYNESELLLSHISRNGLYDGFILLRTEMIYRLEFDGPYEKKMETLYRMKAQRHDELIFDDDEILYPLMEYCIWKNLVVTMEYDDAFIVSGIPERQNEQFIYLRLVSDYGEDNGLSVVTKDEILKFLCDTDNEQDLRLLNTMRNSPARREQ
ncbi:MAG: hypothetical protein QM689_04225 [Oscillospiraceae bacterium]